MFNQRKRLEAEVQRLREQLESQLRWLQAQNNELLNRLMSQYDSRALHNYQMYRPEDNTDDSLPLTQTRYYSDPLGTGLVSEEEDVRIDVAR